MQIKMYSRTVLVRRFIHTYTYLHNITHSFLEVMEIRITWRLIIAPTTWKIMIFSFFISC